MTKTKFSIILASSLLVLSACNNSKNSTPTSSDTNSNDISDTIDPSTDPNSTDPTIDPSSTEPNTPGVEWDTFSKLVDNIKTNHNYTMEVSTRFDDPEFEGFDANYYNINDKAFYGSYYSGYSGYIYQKDQGYVSFLQYADGTIETSDFYATNPNVGISSLFDLNAENLFIEDYYRGLNEDYYTTNFDSITVACNFSGYIETANFVAPEKLYAKVNTTNEIVVTCEFTVWYIDEITAEPMSPTGVTTITIKDIGTTTNANIESYIENPTSVYTSKNAWTNGERNTFSSAFNGYVPSYIPNASYALVMESDLDYKGTYIRVTDYGCGNQLEAYGSLLQNVDGFAKTSNTKYTKTVQDLDNGKQTVYTVEMAYVAPTTEQGKHLVGDYAPEGIFQVEYRVKTSAISIESIAALNKYMRDNHYDDYVPTLPFEATAEKLSSFADKTDSMNQTYGDVYAFNTGTAMMKIYFSNASKAKNALQSYINLLEEYGYNIKRTMFGTLSITLEGTEDLDNPSIVQMSDPDSITDDTYQGFVNLRFAIYKNAKDYVKKPTSGDTPAEATLTSIEVSNVSTSFNVGDTFVFDGTCYANYSDGSKKIVTPTSITGGDTSTEGTKTVTVSYTEGDVTVTTTYTITVSPKGEEESLAGVYRFDYTSKYTNYSLVLTLNEDGTGTYQHIISSKTNTANISWVQNGNSVLLTYVNGDTFSDSYNLFYGSNTVTGTIGYKTITIEVGAAAIEREFAKQ